MFRPAFWFSQFIKFCASNFNEFLDKNGPYNAAAISFYSLFSLFPLMLALVSVFGFLLGIGGFQEKLIEGLQRQVPVLEESGDAIVEVLESLSARRTLGSILAAIGLMWSSTAVFGSIRKSINNIWGIRRTRPFLMERGMDLALMIGAALLMFGSVFVTATVNYFQDVSAFLAPDAPIADPALWQRLATPVPLLMTFWVFVILYWWLPNTRLRFSDVWPTALAGAIAFEITKACFVFYLKRFDTASAIYGAVSAIIILMAWVYVSAIIMLVGAQLTSRYVFFRAAITHRKRNEYLWKNLERVRSLPGLPGMPAAAPSGAAVDHENGGERNARRGAIHLA